MWQEEERLQYEAEKERRKESERQRLEISQSQDEVEQAQKERGTKQQEEPFREQGCVTGSPLVLTSAAPGAYVQWQGLIGGYTEEDRRVKMLQYLISQGELQQESYEQNTKRAWTHEAMYLQHKEQMSQGQMLQEQSIWVQNPAW